MKRQRRRRGGSAPLENLEPRQLFAASAAAALTAVGDLNRDGLTDLVTLHTQNVVHRDLAARTVQVTSVLSGGSGVVTDGARAGSGGGGSAAASMLTAVLGGQPGIDEPIRNPVVHVSGDLATVWAEYQVRREGTVTHCGFDAFHLARRDGRWKLLNISDTYQTTGCGPAWPN